jgi:hypothetical protein
VPDHSRNCHCLQAGVSQGQKTPHIYHLYNLNVPSELPADLAVLVDRYFRVFAKLMHELTGNPPRIEARDGEPAHHPQVIQYPAGGGLFGRHVHQLRPQLIGSILGLSKRGVDYTQGGTGFAVNGTSVDTSSDHDFGDILLFRNDVPHWVIPSDTGESFDWSSEAGRWSMVLPFY